MMNMKVFYLLIAFLLCYSCNNSQTSRKDSVAQEMSILNDSVLNLMFEFNISNDTTFVEKALSVSDRMLEIDINHENEFRILYLRAQVLQYLGRYKENFELMGRIYDKYGSNIDKMIYKGFEYKIKGMNDSAQYCLNTALDQCNNVIADSIDIVYKIAEIYIIMDKKSEITKMIEELSIKYPDKIHDLNFVLGQVDIIEKNQSLLYGSFTNTVKASN